MAVIISLANQKGGAGKSLMSELIAKAFSHSYKKKVLIIDCDPQWTITELRKDHDRNFPDLKFKYDNIKANLLEIKDIAKEHYNDYDYILVDIPGFMHTPDGKKHALIQLLSICDVIFMPVIAESESVIKSSAELYFKILEVIKAKNENGVDMDLWAFVNRYKKNTENETYTSDNFDELRKRGFTNIISTYLSDIAGYRRTHEYSKESVHESTFLDKKHKKEFKEFMKEVYSITSQYE